MLQPKSFIDRQRTTISSDVLKVSTDFETGSGTNLKIEDECITLRTVPDPVTNHYTIGYDYYFHVSFENKSQNDINKTFIAVRPNSDIHKIDWKSSKSSYFCSTDKKKWFLLTGVMASENHLDYKCEISIPRGKTLFISNNIPINPKIVSKKL